MAFSASSVTELETNQDLVDAASFDTSSLSFTTDTVYIVIVGNQKASPAADANVPTLSGWSSTWTEINSLQIPSAQNLTISAFRAVPSSTSSGVVTIDFASQTQTFCAYSVIEVADANTSSIVAQSATDSAFFISGPPHTFTVSLAPGVTTGNLVISGYTTVSGSTSWSAGTNETTIGQDIRIFTQYNLSDDGTSDVDAGVSTYICGISIEINAGGGGGGIAIPIITHHMNQMRS